MYIIIYNNINLVYNNINFLYNKSLCNGKVSFESRPQIVDLREIYSILYKYMENVELGIDIGLHIRYRTFVTETVCKHQLHSFVTEYYRG